MMQISPNESFWHGIDVEIQLFGPESCCDTKRGFVLQDGGASPPSRGMRLLPLSFPDVLGASPPLRAQTKFFKALKQLAASGYQPADAVGEVATLPPADVSAVATAVAAGLLGTVPESMRQAHADQQRYEAQIRLKAGLPEEPIYTTLYIDGTEQINEVARSEAGAPATLAAAVQAMERDATGTDEDAVVTMPASAAPAGADEAPLQSPSAFGKPFEGATMGWKPFLWPWPPGIALVGFFAGAILANQNGLSS